MCRTAEGLGSLVSFEFLHHGMCPSGGLKQTDADVRFAGSRDRGFEMTARPVDVGTHVGVDWV